MKKHQILLLLLLISKLSFSQHTKAYLDFVKDYEFVDSLSVELKWKNGNLKEKKKVVTYKYDNKEFEVLTGSYIQFNKKGIRMTESLFDIYGNYLYYKLFDAKGNLILEDETLKIDMKSTKSGGFIRETTAYVRDYMMMNGEAYLYEEGRKMNGKKIGKWIRYNGCGEIVKEKNYSK